MGEKMSNPIKDIQLYQGLCDVEELLQTRGWCKGVLRNDKGEFCIRGAIDYVYVAQGKGRDLENLRHAVEHSCYDLFGAELEVLNDSPLTTFENIKAILKKAREQLQ